MTIPQLPKPTGSWRTASAGIGVGAAMLIVQFVRLVDGNPATVFSEDALMTAVGMIWLGWVARDNKVTSQQAGAE